MMNCEEFLEACRAGRESEETLEHLRACDLCLGMAIELDPENLFRAIGGAGLEPPGGVDAFVDEVMQEVHLRETERRVVPRSRVSAPWRWAAAAALAVGVLSASLIHRTDNVNPSPQMVQTTSRPVSIQPADQPVIERPVIENYQNSEATIVEIPSNDSSDVKIVMIFDDSLPAGI